MDILNNVVWSASTNSQTLTAGKDLHPIRNENCVYWWFSSSVL